MNETEITVQCNEDLETIKSKLQNQNFVFLRQFQLNDWYFSAKSLDELNKMNYSELIKNSFLLRQIIENDGEYIHICYKDKVLDIDGNVISENKTKANIDSLESAISIFNNAGLTMWCKTENTSYVYGKDNIELCIQDIADLGIFIEFEEYDEIKNLSPSEKFETMKSIVMQTKLSLGNDFSCKKVFMKFKNNY